MSPRLCDVRWKDAVWTGSEYRLLPPCNFVAACYGYQVFLFP